jgi:hypothetical protein
MQVISESISTRSILKNSKTIAKNAIKDFGRNATWTGIIKGTTCRKPNPLFQFRMDIVRSAIRVSKIQAISESI